MRSPFSRPKPRKQATSLEVATKSNGRNGLPPRTVKASDDSQLLLPGAAGQKTNTSHRIVSKKIIHTQVKTPNESTTSHGGESATPVSRLNKESPLSTSTGEKGNSKTWSRLLRLKGKGITNSNIKNNDVKNNDVGSSGGRDGGGKSVPLVSTAGDQPSPSRWLPRRRSVQPPLQTSAPIGERLSANAGTLLRIFKKDATTNDDANTATLTHGMSPISETLPPCPSAPEPRRRTSQQKLPPPTITHLGDRKDHPTITSSHTTATKEPAIRRSITAVTSNMTTPLQPTRRDKRGSSQAPQPVRLGEKHHSKTSVLTSILKGKLKSSNNASSPPAQPASPHPVIRQRTSQILLPPALAHRGDMNNQSIDLTPQTPNGISTFSGIGTMPATSMSPRHQKGGIPPSSRPRLPLQLSGTDDTSSDTSTSMSGTPQKAAVVCTHTQPFPFLRTLKRKADQQPSGHQTKRVALRQLQLPSASDPDASTLALSSSHGQPIGSLKRTRTSADLNRSYKRCRTGRVTDERFFDYQASSSGMCV